MEKIKQYLKYAGITFLIIGIFAGIRYLALEFAAVRWTMTILICSAINQEVSIPEFVTFTLIAQICLNYLVAGFFFGYGNINGLISDHWVGFLISVVVLLCLFIYIDIHNLTKQK